MDTPGTDSSTFKIKLDRRMFSTESIKLKIISKPKLTLWSKICRLFRCNNDTWFYKVEKL